MSQRDTPHIASERLKQHIFFDERGEVRQFLPRRADVVLQLEPDIAVVEDGQVIGERLNDADDLSVEQVDPFVVLVLVPEPANHGADVEADRVGELSANRNGDRLAGRNVVGGLRRPFALNHAGVLAQVFSGQKVGGKGFLELVVGASPADHRLRGFGHAAGFADEPLQLSEVPVAGQLCGLIDGGYVGGVRRPACAGVVGEEHGVGALRDQFAQREVGGGGAVDERQGGERGGDDQHGGGDEQQPPAAAQLPQSREPDQSQHPRHSPSTGCDRLRLAIASPAQVRLCRAR